METLYDFATPEKIQALLVKERVKCCKKNRKQNDRCRNHNDKSRPKPFNYYNHLNESTDEMSIRIGIDFLMPPRGSWMRPSKRIRKDPDYDAKAILIHSLTSTLKRDKKLYGKLLRDDCGKPIFDENTQRLCYMQRLNEYINKIRERLRGDKLKFNAPEIEYLQKKKDDMNEVVEFRPIAIYGILDDKIILAIVSKYLANHINGWLHDNILSYRPKRQYNGELVATDFNSGIQAIGRYRVRMGCSDIYVSDCDIKKFYDTINHDVVKDCFNRILEKAQINGEAKRQVMAVLDAYLESYDFYTMVHQKTREGVRGKRVPEGFKSIVKWVEDDDFIKCYGSDEKFKKARDDRKIGVPQGGALSLLIANIVLNDIDSKVIAELDDRLFLYRFCDDMVLMHPDLSECTKAKKIYERELKSHYLVYHDFTDISTLKNGDHTMKKFWNVKSHSPFLWDRGPDGNNWIGFLGYEMNRAGQIRLRMSNVQKFESHIRRKYHSLNRQLDKFIEVFGQDTANTSSKSGKGLKKERELANIKAKLNKAIKKTQDNVLYNSYTVITDSSVTDIDNGDGRRRVKNCRQKVSHLQHQMNRIDYCRKLFLTRKLESKLTKVGLWKFTDY